ncbi:MAG: polysulfide reductase [Chloroflexi bacterium]|nr:polysulfide reductase [Chloroflexota bacterium]
MLKKVAYAFGVVALLAGSWGLYSRLIFGERDVNYGSYVIWGLWVAMYLFFAGVAAGGFMLATLDLLFRVPVFRGTGKVALWGALVSLAAALVSIWFDLGHMERIWKVYLQGNPGSVMFQMVLGYTVFGLIVLVSLILALRRPESSLLRVIMAVGLPVALFVSGAIGALLGVNAARPFWHVGLFPVQFPVFSLASGAAMMLVAIGLFGTRQDPNRPRQLWILSLISVVLLVVKLYFMWADYSQSIYGNVPMNVAAVNQVLYGRYWWAFWILQIAIGTLIPIIVLTQRRLAQHNGWAGWMGLLILVGYAVARALIIFPALSVPELTALTTAFSGPHLTFDYFPSLMEWSVTAGIVGVAVLAFLIGTDRLRLFHTSEVTR